MSKLILNRKDQRGEYRNNYDKIEYWREHRIEILTKIEFSNKNSVPLITRKGVHQGARSLGFWREFTIDFVISLRSRAMGSKKMTRRMRKSKIIVVKGKTYGEKRMNRSKEEMKYGKLECLI